MGQVGLWWRCGFWVVDRVGLWWVVDCGSSEAMVDWGCGGEVVGYGHGLVGAMVETLWVVGCGSGGV